MTNTPDQHNDIATEHGPGGPSHPYHIVDPSPWPLLSSLAGGLLAFGAVEYMHDGQWPWLIAGFVAVISCMVGWWRDVLIEAVVEKAHSSVVTIGFKWGMILFIASELMFFFAFFWGYFNASLMPTDAIGGIWPPEGSPVINPLDLPFLMTLLLLLSGCTVTWAHHEILEGNSAEVNKALAITVLLGMVFSGFQVYEYSHLLHEGLGFGQNVYSSVFYMATGFHGAHVIIGTIFLAVCWWRNVRGHFTPDNHFGFEAAAWYWHFVDVVWLFLFVCVYWFGG